MLPGGNQHLTGRGGVAVHTPPRWQQPLSSTGGCPPALGGRRMAADLGPQGKGGGGWDSAPGSICSSSSRGVHRGLAPAPSSRPPRPHGPASCHHTNLSSVFVCYFQNVFDEVALSGALLHAVLWSGKGGWRQPCSPECRTLQSCSPGSDCTNAGRQLRGGRELTRPRVKAVT